MRLIIALLFLFSAASLSGQHNDNHIYVDVKEQVMEAITINSLSPPKIKVHNYALTDSIGFDPNPIATNSYVLNFQSKAGYLGDISTVVEYTQDSNIPGISQKNYFVLHTQAKTSVVSCADDFVIHDGTNVIVDAIQNDSTTEDSLSIVKIGYVSGGTATITSDNKISYSPLIPDGTIIYYTKDEKGTVGSATIDFVQDDNTKVAEFDLYTQENKSTSVILSSGDYTIDVSPEHGELLQSSVDHVWSYIPDTGYSGSDNFSFTSTAGGKLEYEATVFASETSNSSTLPDELYLQTDGTITFDVLANDFNPNATIIYCSPELTKISNGVYQYTSSNGSTGDLNFEYKIFTGTQVFAEDITIHVDDFAPTETIDYNFQIIKDQDLTITHQTPMGDYFLTENVEPSHGTVWILDEFGQAVLDCDTITGANTIVYIPDAGYTGSDAFDIQYSTGTGFYEIVKIDINITDSAHTVCLCADGCVFQGDHNDDGKVDMLDVLDLGLNVGAGGHDRDSDFNEIWTGQYSSDWGYGQMGTGIDLKCGDSDGDGYIDAFDTDAVDEHYGNIHRLQSEISAATTKRKNG